jgi:hypothetical protein
VIQDEKKTPDLGFRMNIPYNFSESLETVFWVKKYLNCLTRIRDPEFFDPGSGMAKFGARINIPVPQHWMSVSYPDPLSFCIWVKADPRPQI